MKPDIFSFLTAPFRYVQDPPRVVDSEGVTLLEIRGFSFLESKTNGEDACDIQDDFGETLVAWANSQAKFYTENRAVILRITKALGRLRKRIGDDMYNSYLDNVKAFALKNHSEPNVVKYLLNRISRSRTPTLSELINEGFSWAQSPQGRDPWSELFGTLAREEESGNDNDEDNE